jgi:uncharacterized protein (TIGR04255 family)
MNSIPKRLREEPLIEAIWQVQFESPNAGDVLPGLLYAKLKKQYSGLQLNRLPKAEIPAAVVQFDPNLRFAAKVRFDTMDAPFLWQVGDRVATLNCRKPYVGWERSKVAILDLIQTVEDNALVQQPLRHSLRYIDLLTLDTPPELSSLQLSMRVGAHAIQKLPLQARIELPDGEYLHVIQIATPAQVQLPEGIKEGSVVGLETLMTRPLTSWEDARDQLEGLHDRSKPLFFEHLITPDAIQALDPEY